MSIDLDELRRLHAKALPPCVAPCPGGRGCTCGYAAASARLNAALEAL